MTKKFLTVSFLSLLLVACGENSSNSNSSGSSSGRTLELTEIDKKLANGNVDEAGKILLQKAILQEAKNEKLTEEDQYNLNLAKEDVEINFFLQKKFNKEFAEIPTVTEEEVKKYYDEYKAEFGNTPFETLKDAIVNEIIIQRQNEIVYKYYDELAKKYKINDILNKEYSQDATNTEEKK